jgi:hypothetical protein
MKFSYCLKSLIKQKPKIKCKIRIWVLIDQEDSEDYNDGHGDQKM